MTLEEKIAAVNEVYARLDDHMNAFRQTTGMHCLPGCGKCCFKADIEATVLEFLPFAHYLYTERQASTWLRRLKTSLSPVCAILDPGQKGQGLCSQYNYRGLICRLFGFSARRNKLGRPELVTCQVIKTELKETYEGAVQAMATGSDVPVMASYYMQLYAIDADLGRELYPINMAIRKAIEVVIMHYTYRTRRSA